MTLAEANIIIARLRHGESLHAIAKSQGRCHKWLAEGLLRLGISVPKQRIRNKDRAFEIICRYRGGESQVSLARYFGVSQPAIHHTIRIHSAVYDEVFREDGDGA